MCTLWKRTLSNDKYHFAYFVTPTLKSFLVFLTEENPQRSQTSTIANTDNMFTYAVCVDN
jgi:hypothetical protein